MDSSRRALRGTTKIPKFLPQQKDQPYHGPPNLFEDAIEVKDVVADSNVDAKVEDVAATHDSNVEVDAELTEPSQVGPINSSLFTGFKTHIATAI
ncbi:unnamed protein product [Prunus armeniaca]